MNKMRPTALDHPAQPKDFAWLYEYELGTVSGVVFAADENTARIAAEDAAIDEARSVVGEAEANVRRLVP